MSHARLSPMHGTATLVHAVRDALDAALDVLTWWWWSCRRAALALADPASRAREAATIDYIKAHANDCERKVMVFFDEFTIFTPSLVSLTVPRSEDGRRRWVDGYVVQAYINLLFRRCGGYDGGYDGVRDCRFLLKNIDEQYWLEYLDGPRKDRSEQELDRMAWTANTYLKYDLLFIPIYNVEHRYVIVVNFRKKAYHVLDSLWSPGYSELRSLLKGINACMKEVGHKGMNTWDAYRVCNLPWQTDQSSCSIFMLMYMEFWDGEKLVRNFTQKDVETFRTKLAEELVFSENELENVKEEIEWRM